MEEGLVGENRGWVTSGAKTGGRASGRRGGKVVEASGAPLQTALGFTVDVNCSQRPLRRQHALRGDGGLT